MMAIPFLVLMMSRLLVQADAFSPTVNNNWASAGNASDWWGLLRVSNTADAVDSPTPYSYSAAWAVLRGPLLLLLMCFIHRFSQVRL